MLCSICASKGIAVAVLCMLCGMQAAHLQTGFTVSGSPEVQTASNLCDRLCGEAAWCKPSTGRQQDSLRARCGRCGLPGRLWPHPSGPVWTPAGAQAAAADRLAPLCWQRTPQPVAQTARSLLTGCHLQQARRLCGVLVIGLHDTMAIRCRKATCTQGSHRGGSGQAHLPVQDCCWTQLLNHRCALR